MQDQFQEAPFSKCCGFPRNWAVLSLFFTSRVLFCRGRKSAILSTFFPLSQINALSSFFHSVDWFSFFDSSYFSRISFVVQYFPLIFAPGRCATEANRVFVRVLEKPLVVPSKVLSDEYSSRNRLSSLNRIIFVQKTRRYISICINSVCFYYASSRISIPGIRQARQNNDLLGSFPLSHKLQLATMHFVRAFLKKRPSSRASFFPPANRSQIEATFGCDGVRKRTRNPTGTGRVKGRRAKTQSLVYVSGNTRCRPKEWSIMTPWPFRLQ